MRLENINLDCVDSAAACSFCAQALDAQIITRDPTRWEARLRVGEFWMDLCFETVPEPGAFSPGASDAPGRSRQAG